MPYRTCVAFCLGLAFCLAVSGCQQQAVEHKVAVVDVELVLKDSRGAKQANGHLAEVQKILQKGLEDYQAELSRTPDGATKQSLQQGLDVLRRQLTMEQNAARNVVTRHMLARINDWHAARPDYIVIARQNLLAAPGAMDITADIIARMDAGGDLSFGDLPRVTINRKADAGSAGDTARAVNPEEPVKPAQPAEPGGGK